MRKETYKATYKAVINGKVEKVTLSARKGLVPPPTINMAVGFPAQLYEFTYQG